MAAAWSRDVTVAMSPTASTAADAVTNAAPTTEVDALTLTSMAGATIMATTTTTTIPVTTTAADIMAGPMADGAHRWPGAGAGAEIPGTDTTATISTPIRSTPLPHSG